MPQQFTSKKIKYPQQNKKIFKDTHRKTQHQTHKKYIMLMGSNRWKPIPKPTIGKKYILKKIKIFQNTAELPFTSPTIFHIPKAVEMTDLHYCGLWIPHQ